MDFYFIYNRKDLAAFTDEGYEFFVKQKNSLRKILLCFDRKSMKYKFTCFIKINNAKV